MGSFEGNRVKAPYDNRTLAAVTNGADDTYYYYLDMRTWKRIGLQLILSGGSGSVTVTVEATYQDDGTVKESITTYVDITNDVFGAASYTATAFLNDYLGKSVNFTYMRVKVVASTGGADDADWTIYSTQSA